VLPHVAVIDLVGLNDYVVARIPPPKPEFRQMAHDRLAPTQYVKAFRPNVQILAGRAEEHKRRQPLTDDEIRALEHEWRNKVRLLREYRIDPYARSGSATEPDLPAGGAHLAPP
jgi:hypothetical protein